ncbi:chorismate synthase [Aerococcaceae bacterium WGS1372]
MLRFITAGESHGPSLTTIIEGLPAGIPIDTAIINEELAKRQEGYGRGNRMKIETDIVEITSGVRYGKTLGSPLTMVVTNRDNKNWKSVMGIEPNDDPKSRLRRAVHRPRPGHADLVGGIKYHHEDLRNVLERSSARETAMRVAIGAIAKQILNLLGVEVVSYVREIGGIQGEADINTTSLKEIQDIADRSIVKMIDVSKEKEVIEKIDATKLEGNTLGGVVEVIAEGLPVGLGSYTQFDKKLDGRLAQAMMSINAFKGVEIGDGFEMGSRYGSEVMDEIGYTPEKGFFRLSNHLGGLEGGMTNGMPIIIRGVKKPIPTLYKPLQSVDIYTKENYEANIERSDTTAVPAASVVAKAVIATELVQAILEKFPNDSFDELKKAVNDYREYSKNPTMWQNAITDEV